MTNEEAIEILKTFREVMDDPITNYREVLLGSLDMAIEALKNERPHGEWYEHIDKGVLKARHGDYVLYKVDYLLDNLAREVNIMKSARKMKGGTE